MAAFVYQFEANLVNMALPAISAQLQLNTFYASLIPVAYLIGAVAVLILAGNLGAHFGLKRIFILSIALMTLGTVVCGMAACFPVLFGGRLLQGIGAGGMAALGYAIIPAFLPPSLAGYGYGRLSMAAGLGMLAGNPAGGMLSQFASWRFVFLATVPIMLVLVALSLRRLPADGRIIAEEPETLPLADSLLFGFCAASMIAFLSFGSEFGFASTPVVGILVVFAVLAAWLIRRSSRGSMPLIPRMIANRMFSVSVLGIIAERCVIGGIIFLMPFYLTALCALPPAFASVLLLLYAAGFAISAPFSGAMADKGRSGTLLFTAALTALCACALFSACSPSAHWGYALVFLVIIGIADGMYTPSANKSAVGSLPEAWKRHAAVFLPLAVSVGIALGVSLFELILSLPFPSGESFIGGASGAGLSKLTVARGFQGAFLASAVLWAGLLFCAIYIRKRKEAAGYVAASG